MWADMGGPDPPQHTVNHGLTTNQIINFIFQQVTNYAILICFETCGELNLW